MIPVYNLRKGDRWWCSARKERGRREWAECTTPQEARCNTLRIYKALAQFYYGIPGHTGSFASSASHDAAPRSMWAPGPAWLTSLLQLSLSMLLLQYFVAADMCSM